MQDLFGPVRTFEPINVADHRYAIVFEPTRRRLEAALQFAGDAERVLLGVEPPIDRGTTPATLLPLLRLLAVDPLAHVLVLLPSRDGRIPVYAGSGTDLAMMVKRHAPACWAALTRCFFQDVAVAGVYAELPRSDLASDVLDLESRPRPAVSSRARTWQPDSEVGTG